MEKSKLKMGFLVFALVATVLIGAVFSSSTVRYYARSTGAYWFIADNVATPLMRKLDPERAHDLTVRLVKDNYAPRDSKANAPILRTSVWGLNFANPLGIAAGFDKQALAIEGLLQMGFGFVEVGGVTPEPQEGNPKPRMFRLTEDGAVINRYGLNSEGQTVVGARLAKFKAHSPVIGIVGVNIAKNTTSNDIIEEYKKGVRNLAANVDFIVLNVSCPNVAWTKNLADSDEMVKMVCAVKEERDALGIKTPLLMKVAPDMSDDAKHHMAEVAIQCGVDGLIVSNTTSSRAPDLQSEYSKEMGGLSGRPIKQAAQQSVRDMYRLTGGRLPIIGVGGIESGQDAYDRIRAGASLLQIYTGLVYQGPGLVLKIKRDLAKLLQRDGFKSVADAVGVDAKD